MTSGIGENNISKLLEIKRKTRQILENHHPDYFNFELHHIARVNYTDIEMDKGKTYFFDAKAINNEEYLDAKKSIVNKEPISLGQLQPEILAQRIIESMLPQ